jgi:hypothetical protein
MAIAFTYTESTNTVVVTGGTSGTPATFADFVTADRAGTGTDLLTATAGASNNTLTYAVRPVEDLAILVKCIVAGKTAETDYIFITGTDWRGAAQTESIDVSAGNGSYTTTKYWASISNLDCSDNAAGGGTVWADGTLQVTQDRWGVIWDYGNNQYKVDSIFTVGDGSTSTYFASVKELVYFALYWQGTSASTIRIGLYENSQSEQGSTWVNGANPNLHLITGWDTTSVINIYDSILVFSNSARAHSNNIKFYDSRIVYYGTGKNFYIYNSNSEIINTRFHGMDFMPQATLSVANKVFINDAAGVYADQALTLPGVEIANSTASARTYRIYKGEILTIENPITTPTQATVWNDNALGEIHLNYTVDIHIADKDGVNLQGATVLCEETGGAQQFSVSTAADGTITQQSLNVIKWVGTSETETDYNPHKFTISKAGYETLILENITVDGPIDWHLELQDPVSAKRKTYIFVNED